MSPITRRPPPAAPSPFDEEAVPTPLSAADAITQVDAIMPAVKLARKDLLAAAQNFSLPQARYLVACYYRMQGFRMRADGHVRAATASGVPNTFISELAQSFRLGERTIESALGTYTTVHPVGKWLRSITGIGPVIAAGLLAHLDEDPPATAAGWWRFAGYDPSLEWGKGEQRPYNARLKTLLWKAGQSFVMFSNHPASHYGPLWRQRKEYEQAKNAAGDYAAQAALWASRVKADSPTLAAYRQGRLPDGHIHARACRWTVKLFLADIHLVMTWHRLQKMPAMPYAIAFLGHAHAHHPPNAHLIPGLIEALAAWRPDLRPVPSPL